MNDGWCMMDDAWWMMHDGWWMMHDGWRIDDWYVWLVCWLMDMTHSYDQGPIWWMPLWGISFGSLDEGLPWWKMMENQGLGWGINSQWCIQKYEGWMMTFDKCIINDETWMTGRMIHPWLMNTCCWWWSVDPQLAATKAPLGLWCLLSGSDHLSYGRWYFQALPSTLECDGNRTEIEGMDTSYISEHVSHSSESRNFLRVDSYQWTDIWPTPHYPTGFEKVVCDVGKFPPKWPNRYLEVEEDGKITILFSELQLSDLPVG